MAHIAGISAGGMPDRVKCLHVLVAHALAAGPGVNPFGDEALALLAERGITPATAWGGSALGCDAMTVHRAAAIDCGTNSIRLLIADVDTATGRAVDVRREMLVVRLGEGVDATGAFAPAALARTFDACRTYAAMLAEAGDPPLRFVATSASRDVSNRAEFIAGVRQILGVAPEVISGQEEGELSFTGATRGIPADARAPFLVVDIGGGSTEFVLGTTAPTHRHQRGRRLRADDRAAPGRRPAERGAGRRGHRRHRRRDRPRRPLQSPSIGPPHWSAWPDRSRRWPRSHSSCRPTTRA